MFTNPKRDYSARRFEGKVVALTGSARGIGKNMATAFAREGALVIVCDVNGENGKATDIPPFTTSRDSCQGCCENHMY